MEVLENIPVELNLQIVMKALRQNKAMEECVQELLESVLPIVNPKAVYEVCYVESKDGDSLSVSDVTFTSRVLRTNLDKVGRVFPYVVTCGRELDGIPVPSDDIMKSYCLETIKRVVVGFARGYLEDYLKRTYALGQVSRMSPGSLVDWPINQQKELFSIFGDVESLIGVRLTESYLMVPVKSVSGMVFPTEVSFESCQLCPREICEGRRAPYDPELVKEYGIQASLSSP